VVITTDIPGNSMARRPDGRGRGERGLLGRHAGGRVGRSVGLLSVVFVKF